MRLGNGQGHPAVLEGAGGIRPLELQIQLDPGSNLAAQAPGMDERGISLAQRDDRRLLRDR